MEQEVEYRDELA